MLQIYFCRKMLDCRFRVFVSDFNVVWLLNSGMNKWIGNVVKDLFLLIFFISSSLHSLLSLASGGATNSLSHVHNRGHLKYLILSWYRMKNYTQSIESMGIWVDWLIDWLIASCFTPDVSAWNQLREAKSKQDSAWGAHVLHVMFVASEGKTGSDLW